MHVVAERSTIPHDGPRAGDDLPEGAHDERLPDADTPADGGTGGAAPAAAPARTRGAEDIVTVPRSAKALLWQARVGMGVGLLGLALAFVFYQGAAGSRAADADREAVLDAGSLMALRVTTFSGDSIDEWVADTQSLATGTYAEEVATLFDVEIRQGLADNQVQSVGQVTSTFVQDVEDDRATVFAVVRQTFTSLNQPQPISDELRMEIALERVDGEWLTSEVAVLGPSTVSPVAADGAAPAEGVVPATGDAGGTNEAPTEGQG